MWMRRLADRKTRSDIKSPALSCATSPVGSKITRMLNTKKDDPYFGWTDEKTLEHLAANPLNAGDEMLIVSILPESTEYVLARVIDGDHGRQHMVELDKAPADGGSKFYRTGKNCKSPRGASRMIPPVKEIIAAIRKSPDKQTLLFKRNPAKLQTANILARPLAASKASPARKVAPTPIRLAQGVQSMPVCIDLAVHKDAWQDALQRAVNRGPSELIVIGDAPELVKTARAKIKNVITLPAGSKAPAKALHVIPVFGPCRPRDDGQKTSGHEATPSVDFS